jgi:hypothetical protein
MPALPALPRDRVRAGIERRFDVGRMARDYLAVYEGLIAKRAASPSVDVPDFVIPQETPLEPTEIIDPEPAVTSTS